MDNSIVSISGEELQQKYREMMQLYDANMILLSTNSDYNNAGDARITYTFEAGKTYYISVCGQYSYAGSGIISFSC